MLDVESTDYGKPQAFRLKTEAKEKLAALAEAHNTTETKIINAMLIQYGDTFMPGDKK